MYAFFWSLGCRKCPRHVKEHQTHYFFPHNEKPTKIAKNACISSLLASGILEDFRERASALLILAGLALKEIRPPVPVPVHQRLHLVKTLGEGRRSVWGFEDTTATPTHTAHRPFPLPFPLAALGVAPSSASYASG